MSLRLKTLLIGVVAFVALIGLSLAALQMILPSSFARLEEREMREDSARALNALSVESAQMQSAAIDWARRDDTYAFIEDANAAYIASNLTDSAFTNLDLNVMVFVHSSGRIVIAKGYDLEKQKEMPVPPSLYQYLTPGSFLLNHPDTQRVKTGIVSLPEGPLLVASLPILTSQNEGPIRGTLIFGRFLDSAQVARLAKTTRLDLAIHAWNDPQLPADFQSARAALSGQTPVVVRPLNEQFIASYTLVKDIYDQPALILRAEAPRDIYQQGQTSMTYLIVLELIVGIVGYVGIYFWMRRLVLVPLARLSQNVRQISAGVLAPRVSVLGDDELSTLAGEINQMLEAIGQSQQALRESEERWRAYIEQANDLIFALDASGRITLANRAMCDALGYREAELLGKSPLEFIAPEVRAAAMTALQSVFAGENVELLEVEAITRDERRIALEIRGRTLRQNGNIVGTFHIARDITERKRADENSRESEEKYRTLVERANDGIVIIQDGQVRYVNPSAVKLWGGTTEEVIGTPFANYVAPESLVVLVERYQRRIAGEDMPSLYEAVLRRKDGTPVYAEMNAGLITFDGKPADLVIIRDFTERKRAEQALRDSEKRYRDLFENASDLVYTHDLAGNFTSINRAAERVSGYTRDEVLTLNISQVVAPEYLDAIHQVLAPESLGKGPRVLELEIITKDGRRVSLELSTRLIFQEGKPMGVQGFARDITERKRAEAALAHERHLLRTLIDHLPDYVYVKDAECRYVLNNLSHLRALGVSQPEEIVGKTVFDFFPREIAEEYNADERRVIQSGEAVINKEEPMVDRSNGERRWDLTTKVPWRDPQGNVIGLVGISHDITERRRAEEELRQLKEFNESIVQNMAEGITVENADGYFTFINPAAAALLGYTPEELVGKFWTTVVPPDQQAIIQAADERRARGGADRYETEVLCRDGSRRTVLVAGNPRFEQGRFAGSLAVFTDITERKRAEEALQQATQTLQAVIQSSPLPILALDLKGNVTMWNPAAERVLGWRAEEVIGCQNPAIPEDKVEESDDLFRRVLQGGGFTGAETQRRRKDGALIDVSISSAPLRDGKGNIRGLVAVLADITERKRAEQALQESNARFYALVESIPDNVYLKDTQGRNLYVNKAYEYFAGTSRANIIGKADDEIMPPDLAARSRQSDEQVIQDAGVLRVEESTVDRGGIPIFFETIKSPIFDAAWNVVGLVGVSRNITAHKKAEAQVKEYSERLEQMVDARTRELRDAQEQLIRQERLAVLGQLAGSVAHELRSPLSAIKNAAYYLQMCVENPSADAEEMLRILDQQVDVSTHIIGSLLDFARPKTPTLQRVHLPAVIEAAARQCAIPSNIAVEWNADENLPRIRVDAEQMQLVFRNIITNALQAMADGGRLDIAIRQTGGTMCATFRDTGSGIAPDALDKIFQPLYTTKAKGIGLGLALCKMIVEAHDGTIGVTTEVGKGTTFIVCLPMM